MRAVFYSRLRRARRWQKPGAKLRPTLEGVELAMNDDEGLLPDVFDI